MCGTGDKITKMTTQQLKTLLEFLKILQSVPCTNIATNTSYQLVTPTNIIAVNAIGNGSRLFVANGTSIVLNKCYSIN